MAAFIRQTPRRLNLLNIGFKHEALRSTIKPLPAATSCYNYCRQISSESIERKYHADQSYIEYGPNSRMPSSATKSVHRPINKTNFPGIETARQAVIDWGLDKKPDLTVYEPYAAPGYLTEALLELDNLKQIVIYENKTMIEKLLEKYKHDSRIILMNGDPRRYSYTDALIPQHLPEKQPWDQVHQNAFVAIQLPDTQESESVLYRQLLYTVNQISIYKSGRIQTGVLASQDFRRRFTRQPGDIYYKKLSVLSQLLVDTELTRENVVPLKSTSLSFRKGYRTKNYGDASKPFCDTFLMTPRKDRVTQSRTDFKVLEFIVSSLMTIPGTKWPVALANIAAGTTNLVPKIVELGVDPEKRTNQLSPNEFATIFKVFNEWPFKPSYMSMIQPIHGGKSPG